jgi:hypothetical protein
LDPRDGRGAAAAVRDAMGGETISSNGEPGTKEAEALAAALNHSAERVQTLWFSFLTFMLYLAIATGTTTHRMLFLESPLNLPVLNIALPLLGFYVLTPIIFVVFHFYMPLNLVLLARTARAFEDALARAPAPMGSPRPTRQSSKSSPQRPHCKSRSRDAKFRRDRIALMPLRR